MPSGYGLIVFDQLSGHQPEESLRFLWRLVRVPVDDHVQAQVDGVLGGRSRPREHGFRAGPPGVPQESTSPAAIAHEQPPKSQGAEAEGYGTPMSRRYLFCAAPEALQVRSLRGDLAPPGSVAAYANVGSTRGARPQLRGARAAVQGPRVAPSALGTSAPPIRVRWGEVAFELTKERA